MSETGAVKLSRLLALQRELDAVANNVANVGTTGFKARHVRFEEHLGRVERPEAGAKPRQPVSFVVGRSEALDLSRGAVELTGRRLDLAIEGDAYFVVRAADGTDRYTRDGSFKLDATGRLVTATGLPVLGEGGPLRFAGTDTDVALGPDGLLLSGGGVSQRLRLATFRRPQSLVPVGGNLLRANDAPIEPRAGTARLLQGALERSNVQPVAEMSRLVEVTRAYQLVSGMIRPDGNELQRLADVV